MAKIYVLDTNILIQSPRSVFGFDDNIVVITGTTLQELDRKKTAPGETGFNAREAVRILETVRTQGNLLDGVPTEAGGMVRIEPDGITDNLPQGYKLDVPDNRIISATLTLQKKNPDTPVFLITNDVSMRINASICGVQVQGYRNEIIEPDTAYTGRSEITVTAEIINALYQNKVVEFTGDYGFLPNEYVLLTSEMDEKTTAIAQFKDGCLHLINDKNLVGFGHIRPKNLAQKFLMHALLQSPEEIPLVIVKGPAGTGKTMLAIACGLEGTYSSKDEREYNQMLITRTNVLSDNDLGFLPGTLEEKMTPLVAPFMDNMEFIFSGKEKDMDMAHQQIDYIMDKEIVKICSVAYMRGRSLSNTYLIVDEAQNMTVSQVLEIISRAGMGTKIVLCGDPDQIDNPKLDKRNNGLVFAAERMKDSKLCAQITFDQKESVRSPLAMEAAKKLVLIPSDND